MTEHAVPEGFVAYSEPSPFLDRIGPFFESVRENGIVFGIRLQDHHCNRRLIAHGGLLVTLADVTLGKTAERVGKPTGRLLTMNITYDFVGIGKLGDWLTGEADFYKVGREAAYANCYIRANDKIIGRANGVFKVTSVA
jgi:acyl-coenzyme A thioesterase PaaI-like protein